jgi:hypothetical protein
MGNAVPGTAVSPGRPGSDDRCEPVGRRGIEPLTPSLSGKCSNRLSYMPKLKAAGVGFEPTEVTLTRFQGERTRPLCDPAIVMRGGGGI